MKIFIKNNVQSFGQYIVLLLLTVSSCSQSYKREKIIEQSGKSIYKAFFTIKYTDESEHLISYNSLKYYPSKRYAVPMESRYFGTPDFEDFLAFADVVQNYMDKYENSLDDSIVLAQPEPEQFACGYAAYKNSVYESFIITISESGKSKKLYLNRANAPEDYLAILKAFAKLTGSITKNRNYNLNKNRVYLPAGENIIETGHPVIYKEQTQTDDFILNSRTFDFLNGKEIADGNLELTKTADELLQSLQPEFFNARKLNNPALDSLQIVVHLDNLVLDANGKIIYFDLLFYTDDGQPTEMRGSEINNVLLPRFAKIINSHSDYFQNKNHLKQPVLIKPQNPVKLAKVK